MRKTFENMHVSLTTREVGAYCHIHSVFLSQTKGAQELVAKFYLYNLHQH